MLFSPFKNPINVKPRNPDAKLAALVCLGCSNDLAMAEEREEPTPGPRCREVANEIAVGILNMHCCEWNGIFHASDGILLDYLAADFPKEKKRRIDFPSQMFAYLGNCLVFEVRNRDIGKSGESL